MSSLAFLTSDLQSLSTETRRKHPDVREAAEKSITILRAAPEQVATLLASDGPHAQEILRPVFMGCGTKNAKVVGIALGILQRLIALRAVPASVAPTIVTTMAECASGGVDIQLRILQTLLSLVTNFSQLHGVMLGSALLLCFKLHESRTAVVSSTAAATLRQLLMFVVDKVVEEDKLSDAVLSPLQQIDLPDGTSVSLGPSACDAYAVFEDLCLLANSEKPQYLKLESLPKTFALELIESVVTNYHELFRKHRELLLLLRHHLSPLLLKIMSDRATFPLMLRSTRVAFLLLKQFGGELDTEGEVFFMLLVKIIGGEPETSLAGDSAHVRPLWTRVLAMEIMRGLCTDAELMRRVWVHFDATPDGSSVFTQLVTALKRLVTEKPAILGVSQQMLGIAVPGGTDTSTPTSGMAGMVANAASATVTNVVGIISSGPGLSIQNSAVKLQCIDQLDKADAPPIPESYIYLLGVQCLVSLSDGFATFAAPLYTSIAKQMPRAAGDPAIRAPPALDIASLPADDPTTQSLGTVRAMVESSWPAFLAALSFVITTNLSDDLFVDVLASYQALTNVAGMLNLPTPRDAFFASLSKYAIPTRVVSGVDAYMEPPTPRSATSIKENIGLSGPTGPPGLSERNMACLKIMISSAIFLSGSLDKSWFDVLETIQNAEYVLTMKGTRGGPGGGLSAPSAIQKRASMSITPLGASQPPANRHPMLSDLDPDSVMNAIQRLFDASKNMDDSSFQYFVTALCKLSLAMVGMPAAPSPLASAHASKEDLAALGLPSSGLSDIGHLQRRRVSGIHFQHAPRSGDFAINKLGGVALQNMHRMVFRSAEVAWNIIIPHLLVVCRSPTAPQGIRTQSAKVLDDILLVVPRSIAKDSKEEVQQRVIDALSQQIIPDATWHEASPTRVEISRMGLETLHEILQVFGYTLLVGWESVFEMLASVCVTISTPVQGDMAPSVGPSTSSSPVKSKRPPALGLASERSYAALVKIAFKSLKLVCDSLSVLSPDQLRSCISTIGRFGRQPETNIALTAAESLLWSVSDSIQAKRQDNPEEQEYNAIWMFLLLEVLGLCTDSRSAVRVGAIQTLFRTLQFYGASLSLETWDDCVWKVTFPLLDSINASSRQASVTPLSPFDDSQGQDQAWNDSKVLALQSIGTMLSQFLPIKIIHLESFEKAWVVFIGHINKTVLLDSRPVGTSALQCLDVALQAARAITEPELRNRCVHITEKAWECFDTVGDSVEHSAPSSPGTTEEPIVQPYSQACLIALIDVLRSIHRINDGRDWSFDRLTRMMVILKGVVTYTKSLDFRPDVDTPSPLQTVILDAVMDMKCSSSDTASLLLRHLAGYVVLPFLSAFEAPQVFYVRPGETGVKPSSSGRKRVTYVGLVKKVMPLIVDVYDKHQQDMLLYEDGTVEAIFAAYAIPIKVKYDCPSSSKFGSKDPPLWKTASTSFLRIIEKAIPHILRLQSTLSPAKFESSWKQIIDVYRGGILSDCSAVGQLEKTARDADEAFDRAWLASLQVDVVPHLGNPGIPPSALEHMAGILREGSRVHEFSVARSMSDGDAPSGLLVKPDRLDLPEQRSFDCATTRPGSLLPREAFSYSCFDLLFKACSVSSTLQEQTSRRVAAFTIPALLDRCRTTLVAFLADGSLRGGLPFSRSREEEVLYVLQMLLELRLWPGSLWAALSGSPSDHYMQQPNPPVDVSPSQLISDVARRSTKAHLFQLYPILCEIASSTHSVTAWMSVTDADTVEELEARSLAARCLVEIGKEMGTV